jgi:hypothetical protein
MYTSDDVGSDAPKFLIFLLGFKESDLEMIDDDDDTKTSSDKISVIDAIKTNL